jgi:hypothetical protein
MVLKSKPALMKNKTKAFFLCCFVFVSLKGTAQTFSVTLNAHN